MIRFDHVGAGGSDLAYDPSDISLAGYAEDVLDICHELDLQRRDLRRAFGIGDDRGAGGGAEPALFARLVLVGPSPRYIDDERLCRAASPPRTSPSCLIRWRATTWDGQRNGPGDHGQRGPPELGEELTESFCRSDPQIARQFARVTFLSDNRADLRRVTTPTLILQCRDDVIAPVAVGEYVQAMIPGSRAVMLDATGHCPNLSAPDATAEAIAEFVGARLEELRMR